MCIIWVENNSTDAICTIQDNTHLFIDKCRCVNENTIFCSQKWPGMVCIITCLYEIVTQSRTIDWEPTLTIPMCPILQCCSVVFPLQTLFPGGKSGGNLGTGWYKLELPGAGRSRTKLSIHHILRNQVGRNGLECLYILRFKAVVLVYFTTQTMALQCVS